MITLCSLVHAFAQPGPSIQLIGNLLDDQSGKAIAGASVRVRKIGIGSKTDDNGNFQLQLPSVPATLIFSHVNFETQEIRVINLSPLSIRLTPISTILEEVKFKAKASPYSAINSTYAADRIGLKKIKQSPTTSIYDRISYVSGISTTSSSLTFKTPSWRGFNGSGSTRVNQLVDGMDNQTPGLNFFLGGFAAVSDLDFESIEVLPGASSALYGPGGMNGTVLINSKDPFIHEGLSIMVKQGIMHLGESQRGKASSYNDYSLRWAKAFNKRLALKLTAQYLSAKDWLAADSSNYLREGTSGKLIPGTRTTDPNYDGVNVYGDETSVNIYPFLAAALPAGNPLIEEINVSRTGYAEKDVIDPETKNIKLSGALHYKITDKIEARLMGTWATGNTVYTDDNRYALKGIKIGQYKLELKHKNWFVRSFTTQEDAGEAYSATVTTQIFNEAWKRSFNPADPPASWYPQFTGAYIMARLSGADKLTALNAARAFADSDRPAAGSPEFNQIFDMVRKTPIPNGGLFKEKSQLWMSEGQYSFGNATSNAEIVVGGSFKKYILDSDGTLFIDTAGAIRTNEFGGYIQATKKLLDERLTLVASGRFDKNEHFKAKFTPRFAALVKLAKDNNLRLSFQTAYRFPSNISQWIRLNVGGDYMLLGGLTWVKDYMQVEKYPIHEIINGVPSTSPYQFKDFKPETMRSFEFGYKGLIKNKLLVDVYAYLGKYEDFHGRIGLYQPATGQAYSIVTNSANKVKTYGYGLGTDYRLQKNYSLFFNIYSDIITDVPLGFKSYFNTPKYRFNTGVANDGLGKSKKISFSIMMRWQDAFEWEGELANGPLPAFATVDAQVSYNIAKIKSTFRIGGTNLFNKYYQNAYGNPQTGGLYYIMYAFNLHK